MFPLTFTVFLPTHIEMIIFQTLRQPLSLLQFFYTIISDSIAKIIGHFKMNSELNSRFVPFRDEISVISCGTCFIIELHVMVKKIILFLLKIANSLLEEGL